MIYILSTAVVLGLVILAHELGHFFGAKAMGVKVERFSIGFPPKMFSKKIGETEYVLSWIPFGGYIRMLGEHPGEEEEVPVQEQARSFSHKPIRARFLIVAAGPLSNFILAILIFCAIFIIEGIPHLSPFIGEIQKDMPAEAAGLMSGDKILAINDQAVVYWEDVSTEIRDSEGEIIAVTILRQEKTLTLEIKPRFVSRKDIFGEDHQVPQLGIVARNEIITESVNPAKALYYAVSRTWNVTKLITLTVVKLVQRKVPLESVGGPIFIAQLAGEQARAGLINLLLLTAIISVNLGIINSLPFPILDGGHLFFFVIEMIFRKPVSVRIREKAQQLGLIIIVLLMVLIFYNDLNRLFGFSDMLSK